LEIELVQSPFFPKIWKTGAGSTVLKTLPLPAVIEADHKEDPNAT